MKKHFLIFFCLVLSQIIFAQRYTISGYVEDKATGERLIGASVYDVNDSSIGTSTNVYGFFSLTVSEKQIDIAFSYVGFVLQNHSFTMDKDTSLTVKLESQNIIDEIVISSKRNIVEDAQISRIEIPLQAIKNMPTLMGESDVLKSIQLLPGVQSGIEGMSGIYVRGGGPDQNLILLDGVPVYNVNHLFGFFSVFNGDALSDVSLIKGGFPARYGGRLSSVLDIRMKEGNMYNYKADISMGLIASRATIEGPIIKGKSSFIISARRTYLDLIAYPALVLYNKLSKNPSPFTAGYFFHDFNAKLNYKFSDKDRLYFSFYGGTDKLYVNSKHHFWVDNQTVSSTDKFNLNWGNFVAALRWNHIFTNKLFANTGITYTRFNYNIGLEETGNRWYNGVNSQSFYKSGFLTDINDFTFYSDFDWIISPDCKINFGVKAIHHSFNPGVSSSAWVDNQQSLDTIFNHKKTFAFDYSSYIESEIKLAGRFTINFGGRLGIYQIRDTIFFSPEPRFSAAIKLNKNISFKLAYSEMQQNIHLLANSNFGLPMDVWVPATDKIFPQNSTQYATGFALNLPLNLELSIEGFYKKMNNLVEYKDGQTLFFDFDYTQDNNADQWESKIEQGAGWAYGAEFFLQKNFGKLNGWIGYTLAWNNRQFQTISFGEVFPYKYDRRHDLAIALVYKHNEKIDFGANWVYASGTNVSFPEYQYLTIDDINNYISGLNNNYQSLQRPTNYYGQRNNFKMPDYHRLDLSVNFHKEKNRGTRTWSISIYNAYCKQNPLFIETWYDSEKEQNILYQVSLFPIVPSFTYRFKFK